MKRRTRVVTSLLLAIGLLGASLPATAVAATGDAGAIHTYRATPGDVASERYALQADGTDVFVTKYAWRGNNRVHVARFASDDRTPQLTVTNDAPITSVKISPERYYPAGSYQVSGNTLTFEQSADLPYVFVQINGQLPHLAIINDPLEDASEVPDVDAANVVDVSDYVTDLTGATDQTANIAAAIDALYVDETKDTLYFPDGAYTYGGLELRNRTKPVSIYIDEGALLKNRIQLTKESMEPAIGIWDSANITVSGRGVVDGNAFANYDQSNGGWSGGANESHHQGGAMIVRSQNIVFNDTLLRDAKQWNWETHTAKNVTFNNIKGLTPQYRAWVDGLDLASGQNITVNGALTLGNDDTFASGHYNPDDGFVTNNPDRLNWDTEDSFNITVRNTLGWTAGVGNGIRLGHAAYGHKLRDYTFENFNSVGVTGFGVTVQNQPDSGVRNYPGYEGITIRDSSFDTSLNGTNRNISIYGKNSSNASDRINDVVLENVWFSDLRPSFIENVTNLTISDLTIAGQKITRSTSSNLSLANIVNKSLDFTEDVAPVITAIDPQTVAVGNELAFVVEATDADDDAVEISVGPAGLPEGASFDTATDTFRWTPVAGQYGAYSASFTATDEYGASSSATVAITVEDPGAERIVVTADADTNVQSWNAEASTNYGDNEHLRMLNFNNEARGALGQLYTGGQSGQDAKIALVDFDLADYAERLKSGEVEIVGAELSLRYLGPTKGSVSGTNTLKAARVVDAWSEGNGKTTPTTRTNTVSGAATWLTKPSIDATTVIESAPFDVTATGKVGADATYSNTQTPIGTTATINVLPFVQKALEEGTSLSLALNETKRQDLVFVSTEGAERNSKAQGMAPTLSILVREVAEPEPALDLAPSVSVRCLAGKAYVYATVRNGSDAPAQVAIDTPYGAKSAPALAAGTSLAATFNSRMAAIPAKQVTITGTQEGTSGFSATLTVPATTCG